MELYTSPTSPYARLVRITLAEKQLDERVSYRFVDPWASPEELLAVNPACRVPTLVTTGGHVLTEASLIVLFLERRFPEPRLIPRDAVEPVHARLGEALGCLDCGAGVIAERRYGDPGTALARRRAEALHRAVEGVAGRVASERTGDPDLGDLAGAVALDWVTFRFADEVHWQSRFPAVAAWLERLRERRSFSETAPPTR